MGFAGWVAQCELIMIIFLQAPYIIRYLKALYVIFYLRELDGINDSCSKIQSVIIRAE